MQKYNLGQEVFVFRVQKGQLIAAKGIVTVAEIDKSGYILYTIQTTLGDDKKEAWRANNASIALSEQELKEKMAAYQKFNDEQKAKYVEIFGAAEFNAEELGI